MSLSSVSTLSLANALSPTIERIQSTLSQEQLEVSTGQYADLGLHLGEQAGYELSLRNQSDLLATLTAANSVVSTNLTSTQGVLTSVSQSAQNVINQLTAWNAATSSATVLQSLGVSALQELTSNVNTASNGHYLFAGQNSGVAPLADYFSAPTSAAKTAIDSAFQTAFGMSPSDPNASAITPSALQAFLTGPFAALFQGASWSADWSSASNTNATCEIAPGQSVAVTTSANQPGVQTLTQAYAMISAFAGTALSSSAQQIIASTAASLISQGMNDITSTQATIGIVQQRISDANSMMASQQTLLQTQIGNLDNVNASEVATNINALSTQLQAAYELTAQLHKLSLAQYLPAS
jgi:flagellar hook-associated protein 3 FlgL